MTGVTICARLTQGIIKTAWVKMILCVNAGLSPNACQTSCHHSVFYMYCLARSWVSRHSALLPATILDLTLATVHFNDIQCIQEEGCSRHVSEKGVRYLLIIEPKSLLVDSLPKCRQRVVARMPITIFGELQLPCPV